MKIEKINKRIEEAERQAADTICESSQQREKLKEDLREIKAMIDETIRTGDFDKGQQLAERKAILESKISFLDEFLARKRNAPLMTREEGLKLKNDLDSEVRSIYIEQRKKLDAMFKDLKEISDILEKTYNDSQNTGNRIISVSSLEDRVYFVDQRMLSLKGCVSRFITGYMHHLENSEE